MNSLHGRVSKFVFALSLTLAAVAASPSVMAKESDGPSFNDPQGLCNAIVYLPTLGWHHDMLGWNCISDLKKYGRAASYLRLPSTFQYTVIGIGYKQATKVKLFYDANNPATRSKSLAMMATYAKVLSGNTAFHITKAMLRDIKHGKSFSQTLNGVNIMFKVNRERIDEYVLIISGANK